MYSKISGKIIFKDYLQAALFQGKKLIFIEMILAVFFVFLVFPPETTSPTLRVTAFILGPLAGAFLIFLMIIIRERKNYTSLNEKYHKKIIRINEEGIEYGSQDHQGIYQWSDIKKGVFLKGIVLLYISNSQALLLPKRFFSSFKEQEECLSFIKLHLKG